MLGMRHRLQTPLKNILNRRTRHLGIEENGEDATMYAGETEGRQVNQSLFCTNHPGRNGPA
jgi:hypothetical protein